MLDTSPFVAQQMLILLPKLGQLYHCIDSLVIFRFCFVDVYHCISRAILVNLTDLADGHMV